MFITTDTASAPLFSVTVYLLVCPKDEKFAMSKVITFLEIEGISLGRIEENRDRSQLQERCKEGIVSGQISIRYNFSISNSPPLPPDRTAAKILCSCSLFLSA